MKPISIVVPLILTAILGMSAAADIKVSAVAQSSRVLLIGEPIHLQLTVRNVSIRPLDGTLTTTLTDFGNNEKGHASKSFRLDPDGERQLGFTLPSPGLGYFGVSVSVTGHDGTPLLQQPTVWSVAVLDKFNDTRAESCFGTYTIGNTGMLANIVPRGFYKNMAQMGARYGTMDTWWSLLEPLEGRYDWGYYDQWFRAARKAGLVPIPHLFAIPKWLSSQPTKDDYWTYPPKNMDTWERFVKDFVTRYQDWLVYLRIWNEPNLDYWRGTPAEYAELVKRASRAAKSVKPSIKIIIEAAANPDQDVPAFFDKVHAGGATPYWDIIAIHNYWFNDRNYPERTRYLDIYREFIAWRDAHKPEAPAWDSEFACMADDWAGGYWKGVGETKQAQWLARTHALGFSLGLQKMFWFPGYSWPDPTTPPLYNPAGLLRKDLSPRPAFVVYHTMASALGQAQYDHALQVGADRYALVFKTPTGFVTTLWSIDPEHAGPVALTYPAGTPTVTCTDIMGQHAALKPDPATGALTVDLNENMILLTSSATPKAGAPAK